jgi:uncharacterized protein
MDNTMQTTYENDVLAWREQAEQNLRKEDGWLTVVGLHWLSEGQNTVGSDPTADVTLPASVPPQLGVIDFAQNQATLRVSADVTVLVDGEAVREAALRDDHADAGPSLVQIGSVTFFVIRRGDQYGVRVRDSESVARRTFGGRHWFDIDPSYHVQARFVAHPSGRMMQNENTVGIITEMENPGYVEFDLQGQTLRLEAFDAGEDRLWFVFKDDTAGRQTYKGGRFLYAQRAADGTVDLDFNRAYHPPCVFTDYATCPLPPKENVLPLAILAGERYAAS